MRITDVLLKHVRKFQLSTKNARKGFYKGTGSGSMGKHTKYGGYNIDFDKVRTYVVPEGLSAFKLTPFVTKKIKPMRGQYGSRRNQPISGHYYLNRWKNENGED